MNKEEKKLSNLHTIRNPICERSEESVKTLQSRGKKGKKRKIQEEFQMEQFQPVVDHGDLDEERREGSNWRVEGTK